MNLDETLLFPCIQVPLLLGQAGLVCLVSRFCLAGLSCTVGLVCLVGLAYMTVHMVGLVCQMGLAYMVGLVCNQADVDCMAAVSSLVGLVAHRLFSCKDTC